MGYFVTRLSLCLIILAEIVSNIGLAHLTLIMLTLSAKDCISSVKFYRQPNPDLGTFSVLRTNLVGRKMIRTPDKLCELSNLDLYVVMMVQCRLVRQYTDTASMFIMGPGFVIDVIANYVVIKLHGKIPLLLYLAIALLAILVPVIIMGVLPQAGKSNTYSINLLQHWRGSNPTRWRRKKVRSLRPLGFWVGPLFLIKRQTLSILVNVILDCTANSVLLSWEGGVLWKTQEDFEKKIEKNLEKIHIVEWDLFLII